jgi:hypothetical protein
MIDISYFDKRDKVEEYTVKISVHNSTDQGSEPKYIKLKYTNEEENKEESYNIKSIS